ncbi:methyltransferase domain protein [Pedobacter sp. BAL39]|uniref:class I SAM-dependent methyltransferase n=1 Tax=Pedobacter sp. BAL39 TaxID=391596 RepID=UPI000155957F|nr:class I SAM-dependent methyltransferase [Pedobacter sp. BAL39]EDM34803.1 methyltransferase domain protein [Pedobacter sp. BAL39]
MSDYKDYNFFDATSTHAHTYIAEPTIGLLNPQNNRFILDLGCGNGAFVNQLLSRGFNAYGTDASASGIEIASRRHPDRFALQDLSRDDLPEKFSNIAFDTIVSTEVIEHLYDPRQFIDFCRKILTNNGGGELILSTPYHGYLKNLLLALAGKWDAHANPLWDGGHIKLWSRATITSLLAEKGFTVTNFIGCGRVPYVWKSMVVKARTDSIVAGK